MSRSIQKQSIEGQSGTGAGSELTTGGRITASLFAVANSGDTGSDTLDVQLEVSMDGTNWTVPRDEDGNTIGQLTISEFTDADGNGDPAAFLKIHGMAARYLRARVTSFTDSAGGDLSVDVWVGATDNNAGSSHDYRGA